jgi:hypothetical protein
VTFPFPIDHVAEILAAISTFNALPTSLAGSTM